MQEPQQNPKNPIRQEFVTWSLVTEGGKEHVAAMGMRMNADDRPLFKQRGVGVDLNTQFPGTVRPHCPTIPVGLFYQNM